MRMRVKPVTVKVIMAWSCHRLWIPRRSDQVVSLWVVVNRRAARIRFRFLNTLVAM
jgi:hypothetical protein